MPKLLQSSHYRPDKVRELQRQAQQEQVAPMVRLRAARAVAAMGTRVTDADTLRKSIEAEPHTISSTQ